MGEGLVGVTEGRLGIGDDQRPAVEGEGSVQPGHLLRKAPQVLLRVGAGEQGLHLLDGQASGLRDLLGRAGLPPVQPGQTALLNDAEVVHGRPEPDR